MGRGIGQAQLQEGGVLREGLLGVLVCDGGGNHADLAACHLDLIKGTGVAVGFQILELLLQQRMV